MGSPRGARGACSPLPRKSTPVLVIRGFYIQEVCYEEYECFCGLDFFYCI